MSDLIRFLEDQRDRARASLEALTRERNTWARQMADLRDVLDAAQELADEWRSKHGELDMEHTVQQVEIEDLKSGLKYETECRKRLESALGHAYKERDALRRDLETADRERTALQLSLGEAEQQIHDARADLETATVDIEQLRELYARQGEELDEAQRAIEEGGYA